MPGRRVCLSVLYPYVSRSSSQTALVKQSRKKQVICVIRLHSEDRNPVLHILNKDQAAEYISAPSCDAESTDNVMLFAF